jgi:hypothetical protein
MPDRCGRRRIPEPIVISERLVEADDGRASPLGTKSWHRRSPSRLRRACIETPRASSMA